MTWASNPCLSCGACCAFSREWPRFTLETEAEILAISPALVSTRGMRCNGDRCSALDGEVGVKTACTVYEVRPHVCRSCEAGDPECNMARAKFGFPALSAA